VCDYAGGAGVSNASEGLSPGEIPRFAGHDNLAPGAGGFFDIHHIEGAFCKKHRFQREGIFGVQTWNSGYIIEQQNICM